MATYLLGVLLLLYSARSLAAPSENSVDSGEDVLLRRLQPYDVVQINDSAEKSAGIYFRMSQRGVDYLADLTAEGLPLIFHRMVLPTISESGFTIKDAVITRITRPDISVKFVAGIGIDLSIRLPELEIRGDAGLDVLFVTYQSQVIAVSNDITVNMRVNIDRRLDELSTTVNVTQCSVNRGLLKLNYYGGDASEFYTIGNLIQDGIDKAIRDKICILPPLVRDFIREKINLLMKPPKEAKEISSEESTDGSTVLDHLCGYTEDDKTDKLNSLTFEDNADNEPDVNINEAGGTWLPDLSLRYPPTFSERDLIFGVDGGMLVNGESTKTEIERPRPETLSVLRDQMWGAIVTEYMVNSLFAQAHERGLSSISVAYSVKHIPRVFRPLGRLLCSDCKLLITANLTKIPTASISSNGVQLQLEGDVSAHFFRKNVTHNVLTANSLIRVNIKPHFRQSRLYSDVLLAGVDFKVYKAGLSGVMAGAVRKMVAFIIPRAIWPKIQQRLRLAINYKGIQIPRFCTLELQNLHLDYVDHAAVFSSDFDVDLPLLVRSFKQFMDFKLRNMHAQTTLREYREEFRYLR
ncbi:hypothetical protein M3Y95_00250300 [Aphelenchoides besseyi]|nr:hypothetical protein M3Y95_00250300 [Aphelenchoides besseyi]